MKQSRTNGPFQSPIRNLGCGPVTSLFRTSSGPAPRPAVERPQRNFYMLRQRFHCKAFWKLVHGEVHYFVSTPGTGFIDPSSLSSAPSCRSGGSPEWLTAVGAWAVIACFSTVSSRPVVRQKQSNEASHDCAGCKVGGARNGNLERLSELN